MTAVPTCVKCGASTGTEFPLWPTSNHPFGTICAPCDSALASEPETTMDMRDQQVQDLLEQDKQEALARMWAKRLTALARKRSQR